jgi:ribosomal protein S18 acetylase RimI-like enzyme
MTGLMDADLYDRGARTLAASWQACARGARRAAVIRPAGVAVAVFPDLPERAFLNNALLEHDLGPSQRARALTAMEAAYASAGISRFAAWVHESDQAMREDLAARGYTIGESTRAMGMVLSDIRLPRPAIELAPPDWAEYLRVIDVAPNFARQADRSAFHVLIAAVDGATAAAGAAFDHGDDCGIYNVATLEHARRRGLGTALTALLVHDAVARGCRTATLQSTPMAERVYAAVGFRNLGQILEYAPPMTTEPDHYS